MTNELRNDFLADPMDDFFDNFGRSLFNSAADYNQMKTDVVENDKNYEVTAELPGFNKSDIHMDYRDNNLRINAKHDLDQDQKDDKGKVLNRERSSSNVERAFHLPNVNTNEISANYDDGLLKVSLPKVDPDKSSHHINIQ